LGLAEQYRSKLVSAERAAQEVKSGDWVDYGWCVGHPVVLDKALAARAEELTDVKVRGGVTLWMPEIFKIEDPGKHFTWASWHCTGVDRKIIEMGCGFYGPMKYNELPRFYRDHIKHVDVAMIQVAPMDNHGYFNFGPQASHLMAMLEQTKTIIVEVNENMPRVLGGYEEAIHISQVDYIVEGPNPPCASLPSAPPSEVDKKVAELIVEEIPDGACLQLGIGGMPNAVGTMIAESDLKDLGVHTEMYVDAFVDISNAGRINGAKKNYDRFRQSFAFGAGTQKLYDFVDDNPQVASYPVDYTNHPSQVAKLDNFISINNAIEVDLFGQVCAETVGTRHISGTGGQLDFVQGAYDSKGGKSIICLSASFGKGDKVRSRIRPILTPGGIVTDPRMATHILVTEYGKANLKGKNTWERAEALINIAHPNFRDELVKEAEKMGIWRKSNKL
jgi:butyryl-CoA:acetate CoA-transferase